jgi:hypothetical protein
VNRFKRPTKENSKTMDSQIIQIDKQAADDGDYHTHIRSLLELAKSIQKPSPVLLEIMNEADESLEGDFASACIFAELRDILISEPTKPPVDPREFLMESMKTYLKAKQPDYTEENLTKMAICLTDIVEGTLNRSASYGLKEWLAQ